MEITLDKLTALVNEAYDCGNRGCADLKAQEIEELFGRYNIRRTEDFRVWKAEELRNMPVGSIFQHILRGRCFITARANGQKYMQFDKGQVMDFNSDQDPWDKPMHLIYSER